MITKPLVILLTALAVTAARGRDAERQDPSEVVAEKAKYGLVSKIIATPDHRDTLTKILLAGSQGMPGCLSYVVAKDAEDADALWVTEVWDSKKSHEASLELPAVQQAIAQGKPFIAGLGERIVTTPMGGHGLVRPGVARATGTSESSATSPRTAEDEVRQWFLDWTEATDSGDLERAHSLVAEDAVFVIPHFGRMAPKAFIPAASGSPQKLELYEFSGGAKIEEVRVAGSLAYLWTRSEFAITIKATGEETKYRGHSLAILEKAPSGSWLLIRDLNNVLPLD